MPVRSSFGIVPRAMNGWQSAIRFAEGVGARSVLAGDRNPFRNSSRTAGTRCSKFSALIALAGRARESLRPLMPKEQGPRWNEIPSSRPASGILPDVMQDKGIAEALTGNKHLELAGSTALLEVAGGNGQAPISCSSSSGSCTRTWMTSPHAPHFPEPIAIVCLARQRGHVNVISHKSAKVADTGTIR
jgi:hypothetical protein